MNRQYLVYVIINLINGKIYIGRTSKNLIQRWKNHTSKSNSHKCPYFNKAIKKYGKENFIIDILEQNETLEENQIRERYFIQLFKSDEKEIGYNLENGKWENKKRSYNKDYRKEMGRIQQKLPPKISQYKGIKFSKEHNKYMSNIGQTKENGTRKLYSRLFNNIEDALNFYDRLAIYFYGSEAFINIESNRQKYILENSEEKIKELLINELKSTKFRGVRLKNGKYCSKIYYKNKKYVLGTFNIEQEAAEYYDKFSYFIYKNIEKLNFPDNIDKYIKEEKDIEVKWNFIKDSLKIVNIDNISGFRGVYQYIARKQTKSWVAKIRYKNKVIFIGYFLTKEDAAKAYDKRAFELLGDKAKLNFPEEFST